jgi:hypothetical protein
MKAKLIIVSKLIFFFLIIFSCEDKLRINPVPNIKVDLTLDMNLGQYNINIDQSIKLTDFNYTKTNSAFLGYKDQGIIIYRIQDNSFRAYDATCPQCLKDNKESSVSIKGLYCECPECKSQYYFVNDCEPTNKSVSEYPLKRYNVYNKAYKIIHVVN